MADILALAERNSFSIWAEVCGSWKTIVFAQVNVPYRRHVYLELKIKLAQCHAHARRYFKDVEESNPEITEYHNFYKELSSFEKQAKDFEDLHDIRQTKSKPLIEKMHLWLLDQLPKSRTELDFRKAISTVLTTGLN